MDFGDLIVIPGGEELPVFDALLNTQEPPTLLQTDQLGPPRLAEGAQFISNVEGGEVNPSIIRGFAQVPIEHQPINVVANVNRNSKAAMSSIERKRKNDKAYRERHKEDFMRTKKELDKLAEENAGLKTEIEHLKLEIIKDKQSWQIQDEEIKQLRKSYGKLKEDHDSQATILNVISKKLVSSSGIDPRKAEWMSQINDPEKLEMIQLQEKNASLENEVMLCKTIIEALCAKINKDKHCELE